MRLGVLMQEPWRVRVDFERRGQETLTAIDRVRPGGRRCVNRECVPADPHCGGVRRLRLFSPPVLSAEHARTGADNSHRVCLHVEQHVGHPGRGPRAPSRACPAQPKPGALRLPRRQRGPDGPQYARVPVRHPFQLPDVALMRFAWAG